MTFELLFLCSDRKWHPPRKIWQKNISFKSTAEVISLFSVLEFPETPMYVPSFLVFECFGIP